jgi:hypothetical protein
LNARTIGHQLALCGSPAADQPVCLDQHVASLSVRPQRKADDDDGKAKQQADHHDAAVGWFVGAVKRRTMAVS